jgi:hypothetical protein
MCRVRQQRMKLPTIISGMPQVSRRMVNEKQQLTNPSSLGVGVSKPAGRGVTAPAPGVIVGLNRNTHDVKTAFCVESKATFPYFYS